MAVDVDGTTRCHLSERDQTLTQGGLEIQSVLNRDLLKKAILGGCRWEEREPGEQAKVGTDAGLVSED